jgi:hypothetical protein
MDRADVGLAAKLEALLPHLDERQRRLLLGVEARTLGHGGIRRVARAAGVAEGFSLQANVKTGEGKQHPDRDAQFRYLNEQVKDHQAAEDPVISVDTLCRTLHKASYVDRVVMPTAVREPSPDAEDRWLRAA